MQPSTATLLVVDDNEDNRYTLTRRLQREGYSQVLFATNGREALEVLRDRHVDLVLLDIMMPEMNGYEVLERMKADARLQDMPVVMISAVDEVESVVRCIELGAEDYLPKPFNATLLRARVGASLEKKRLRDEVKRHVARMEEDLAGARAIQLGMVPSAFPPVSAQFPVDIHAALLPAFEVGGDLYDFFLCDAHTLCIAIADVTGKGVAAALFMARTKALIRTVAKLLARASGGCPQPSEVLTQVNEDLCLDNPTAMLVTVFFAALDLERRTLAYCNAGHSSPYLVSRDAGAVVLPGSHGRLLGFLPNASYVTETQALAPGQSLFLFTDGITEAENAAAEFFDSERLEQSLRAAAGADARGLVDAVVDAVRAFAGGARQSDDIAAMAIRLVEPANERRSMPSARPIETVELVIGNRMDELPRVTAAIDDLARRHALPEAAFNMHVALDEVLSNIVKYAFKDGEAHAIAIRLRVAADSVEADVEDDGRAFDPLSAPQQDRATPLAQRDPGRVGISVVRRFMTDVAYRRENGRNLLTMKLRLER